MNWKNKISVLLLFVLLWPTVVRSQEEIKILCLEDALQLMEDQNPELKQAKQLIKQKEYELKSKRALYLPQISLSVKAISMTDKISMDLSPVSNAIVPLYNTLGTYGQFSGVPNPDPATNTEMPFLPDDISTEVVRQQLLEAGEEISNTNWDNVIQEKNFATLSADFIWPIFTGGKISSANKAAGVEVEISKQELRRSEGLLVTELVNRYYGLSLGLQVAEVRKQMLASMEKHYQDSQKMFENGMIARVEVLHASVARNEAERELKQALRNIEIIRSGLSATLAIDDNVIVHPSSELFVNKQLRDIPYWISKAHTNNPQLNQIENKKQLIDIKNNVDKGSYLPTIAIMGSYTLAEQNLSHYLPNGFVGVGMKWTVFDGMSRNNNLKVSKSQQMQLNYAQQKAYNDLDAYIIKLYHELHMQMEQEAALLTSLELAQEYCTSTEKAFNEGFANSSTVVDAISKVAQVKALRLKVLYEYDVTLAQFMQISGISEEYTFYCKGENTITESISN